MWAEEHQDGSFPSGHTSSAFAVVGVVAMKYPMLALPPLAATASIAAIQVPRGKHYASDLATGALIGFVASALTELGFSLSPRKPNT